MEGEPSKINPPNSHPSNPAVEPTTESQEATAARPGSSSGTHEINKAAVTIGVVGAAALIYALMR